MTITPLFAIFLIGFHFHSDWIAQSRYVAKHKKDDFKILLKHIILDITPLMLCLCVILYTYFNFSFLACVVYFLGNVISHGLIDWYLPKAKDEKDLISLTAIDQTLHFVFLFGLLEISTLL